MFYFFCMTIIAGFAIDFRIWRRITPLIASYMGVLIILMAHSLFGERMGFVAVNESVYIYILTFYAIGLLASILCAFSMAWFTRGGEIPISRNKINENRTSGFIIYLAVCIAILCAYFIYFFGNKLGSYVSEDFENSLTYGVPGHTFAMLVALVPFILKKYHYTKSNKLLFFLFVILLLLFMKQVKYWVMVSFVWMIWYSVSAGYIKLNITKAVLLSFSISVLLMVLFFLVYLMKVTLSSNSGIDYLSVLYDIMIHFFGYLYSGILTFSNYISKGLYNQLDAKDILGLFSGPVNVLNILIGEKTISLDITRPFVTLNEYSGTVGNVPSLWGTLLLAGGYLSLPIYFLIIFLISVLQWFSKRSNLALIIYTFLTSFLFFSWFDYYYYLLMPFEVSVLCVIFYIVFERRARNTKTEEINL